MFYRVRNVIPFCSQVSHCSEHNQVWDLTDWKNIEKFSERHKLKEEEEEEKENV